MSTWAAASPALDATVEVIGDDVVLRSCEPAAGTTGATPVGRSQLALSYAALRSQAEAEAVGAGKTTEEAACFGGYIVAHLTPEQMQSGAANDPDTAQQLGTDAAGACF
jgi:hypothetical protein